MEKYNKKPKICPDVMPNQSKNTQTTFAFAQEMSDVRLLFHALFIMHVTTGKKFIIWDRKTWLIVG